MARQGAMGATEDHRMTAQAHASARDAEAAEARGDFDRAALHWWRAAIALAGNPRGLRTEYHRREDAAKAKALAAAREESAAAWQAVDTR